VDPNPRLRRLDYQPDSIKEFVSGWGTENDVTVDVTIIPSLGYSAALQSRLRGGANADVYYNFAYASQKFVEDEWAQTLSDLPQADEALADMFENSRSQYVDTDGNLISLPYFSAVDMNIYNTKMLAAAGIAEPPATLEDYYTQSKALKEQGVVDSPFLGFWDKNVLEHYLITYLLMAGITPFDEAGEPVFADDSKTKGMLEWWAAMYQDGLTSDGILTADPGVHVTAMAQGTSIFFELHHYFLKEIRVAAGPESENVDMAYRSPGLKGTALQIGEVVQMGAGLEGEHAQDAWKLLKTYGWKDEAGAYSTFISWAEQAALLAPYPGLFKEEAFRAAFPDYYDMDKLEGAFENNTSAVSARVAPWYPTFQTAVGDRIQTMLIGEADVDATIAGLADDAISAAQS